MAIEYRVPKGWKVLRARRCSRHPDDAHLQYILCQDVDDPTRFVSWMYNIVDRACYHGDYTERVWPTPTTKEEIAKAEKEVYEEAFNKYLAR